MWKSYFCTASLLLLNFGISYKNANFAAVPKCTAISCLNNDTDCIVGKRGQQT